MPTNPNKTYREFCNTVATLHGQQLCPDDTTFDNGPLDKVYGQLKAFASIANQRFGRLVKGRFLMREFSQSIAVAGNNKFTLNAATTPERLVDKSFYISDTGKGAPLKFYYGGYAQWKRDYPEGEISSGEPRYWFIYPSDGSGTEYFGVSTPVDQTYTINYSGYLRAVPLKLSTDQIIWPQDFDDGITLAAGTFLEFCLAEGKMPDIQQFLDPVFSEIEQNAMGPYEDTKGQDLGLEISPWY